MSELLLLNKQIYGFALGNTSRLLYRLENISSCYIIFPNNLDKYLELILHDQPDYILGLGSYSGIDQGQIRIERICTNKFRNEFIDGNQYKEIEITSFIKPTDSMKYTKAIGNSYCNRVSWKIMQLINDGKLRSQYTFLHIPKTIKPQMAASVIDQSLTNFLSNQ